MRLFAIFLASIFLSCGPAWQQRWVNLGVDSARCGAQGATAAAVSLLATALGAATGNRTDWVRVGEELGARYGVQTAGCIIQAAVTDLSAPVRGKLSAEGAAERQRALEAARYLWQHPEIVERGAQARSLLERELQQGLGYPDARRHLIAEYGESTAATVEWVHAR